MNSTRAHSGPLITAALVALALVVLPMVAFGGCPERVSAANAPNEEVQQFSLTDIQNEEYVLPANIMLGTTGKSAYANANSGIHYAGYAATNPKELYEVVSTATAPVGLIDANANTATARNKQGAYDVVLPNQRAENNANYANNTAIVIQNGPINRGALTGYDLILPNVTAGNHTNGQVS